MRARAHTDTHTHTHTHTLVCNYQTHNIRNVKTLFRRNGSLCLCFAVILAAVLSISQSKWKTWGFRFSPVVALEKLVPSLNQLKSRDRCKKTTRTFKSSTDASFNFISINWIRKCKDLNNLHQWDRSSCWVWGDVDLLSVAVDGGGDGDAALAAGLWRLRPAEQRRPSKLLFYFFPICFRFFFYYRHNRTLT